MEPENPNSDQNEQLTPKTASNQVNTSFYRHLKNRKKLVVLVLIASAWIFLFVVVFMVRRSDDPVLPQASPEITPTTPPSPVSSLDDISSWTFYDKVDKYTFKYPNQALILNTNRGTEVYLEGEGHIRGADFGDGVNLIFTTGTYWSGFRVKVQEELEEIRTYPAIEVVDEIKSVKYGDLEGYTFSILGLRVSEYVYLDLGQNTYLKIIDNSVSMTRNYEDISRSIIETITNR